MHALTLDIVIVQPGLMIQDLHMTPLHPLHHYYYCHPFHHVTLLLAPRPLLHHPLLPSPLRLPLLLLP